MNKKNKTVNLNDSIMQDLAKELDTEQILTFVTDNLKEFGYVQLRARNRSRRFAHFDDTIMEVQPGSFHAAYLGIVISLLHENGLHTERIVVPGTEPQIGECDIYVTLSGMVEPRELHRLFNSAEHTAIGEASNPLHIVTRAANAIPIKMQRVDVNAEISNAYNDPLMLSQTNPIGLRSLIAFVVIGSALVTLIYYALLATFLHHV